MLLDTLNFLALAASFYTCGGAVCRLRHSRSDMSGFWIFLYLYIFALSAWGAAEIMAGGIDALNCLTSIGVGLYIWSTARSWEDGVPPIARPKK